VLEANHFEPPKKEEPAEWQRSSCLQLFRFGSVAITLTRMQKTIKARPGQGCAAVRGRITVCSGSDQRRPIKGKSRRKKGWVAIERPTNAYAMSAGRIFWKCNLPPRAVTPPLAAATPEPQSGQLSHAGRTRRRRCLNLSRLRPWRPRPARKKATPIGNGSPAIGAPAATCSHRSHAACHRSFHRARHCSSRNAAAPRIVTP